MTRALVSGAAALLLAGCAMTPAPPPGGGAPAARTAPAMPTIGLERVMGQDAGELVRLFGPADADIREGTARKLQFVGPLCVLDAYLYPKDGGAPRVSYLDAREPDGSTIDRSSCIAALARRGGGK